jgi:hypothetical protein
MNNKPTVLSCFTTICLLHSSLSGLCSMSHYPHQLRAMLPYSCALLAHRCHKLHLVHTLTYKSLNLCTKHTSMCKLKCLFVPTAHNTTPPGQLPDSQSCCHQHLLRILQATICSKYTLVLEASTFKQHHISEKCNVYQSHTALLICHMQSSWFPHYQQHVLSIFVIPHKQHVLVDSTTAIPT